MPPIERFRDVASEYAHRTVTALIGNDLMGALRAAQIATAALESVRAEEDYHERARQMREQWAREGVLVPKGRTRAITPPTPITTARR